MEQPSSATRWLRKNFGGSEFKLRGSEKFFGGSENKLGAFLFLCEMRSLVLGQGICGKNIPENVGSHDQDGSVRLFIRFW